MGQMLREVNAPYTVNADDDAIGRETIIIRRNGEPVAVVVPYAEYRHWLAKNEPPHMPAPLPIDPEFEKQYAAFQKLLPELLKEHRGDWVGIVNEQAAVFGATRSAALAEVCNRFGDVPMCIQEVREKPRIYKIESPRLVRGLPSHPPLAVIWEGDTESTPPSDSSSK